MTIHFCKGDAQNKVAFILSTPGKLEEEAGCPAAGDTGNNINAILGLLNKSDPIHFPNIDRYRYLITNASTKVMHSAKDNKKTEDTDSNITEQQNINRIRMEVKHCTIVILCGGKANLLAPYLSDKILIKTPHLGYKGLHNKFKNDAPCLKGLSTGKERDAIRLKLCAEEISNQLHISLLKRTGEVQ
ncbi:hypothetical protein AGMMS50256_01360 [Betaproteobacteria bacterium]|nr:hypothetical protein AGMMS50256_01360 [Betaproteobacteria bacterium]